MSHGLPTRLAAGGRSRLESDTRDFVAGVARAIAPEGTLPEFLDPGREISVSRAPARLDVMGGIADYSGSLVLELPLADATLVAAQPSDDGTVQIASLPSGGGPPRVVVLPRELLAGTYTDVRRLLVARPDDAWAGYSAGCLTVLEREHALRIGEHGVRLVIASSVPEGAGVSSSAALTVATVAALLGMAEATLAGPALALACQKVENSIVGSPSGVMDPITTALGREGCLLELLCQPATILGHFPVPGGIELFGIDSGIRHAVGGGAYGAVRAAAFMGYRIIAELAGLKSVTEGDGVVTIADARFRGYLANVGRPELEERYLAALPERLSGAEFLARYRGITDSVTRVDPERTYAVRAATEHPIREHERVRRFTELLRGPLGDGALAELGQAMDAAHRSYGACGLGSEGTDRLVELVREAGPSSGLHGAKITGGGSGGTVAVLARSGAADAVSAVAARYRAETGRSARVFEKSTSGAAAFGVFRLRPDGSGGKTRLEVVS